MKGLFAEHADAGGGRGVGGAEVGVVGSHDRDVVDPLAFGQRGLLGDEGLPVGIASGDELLARGLDRLVGLAPESTRGQLGGVVEQDRAAVRSSEEVGRSAAADHPHAQLSLAHDVVPFVDLDPF